jgi:hypothetical protein
LLQTPDFVEEFILDRTLTPALAETSLAELKLIDPTCGSGHFLLGAFARLDRAWREQEPALDAKERVRRAMNSIHGVDINPFAVAIARFRLTVAGLRAAGERSLVAVPALGFHLAIGDSLLGEQGTQGTIEDELVGLHDGVLDLGDTLTGVSSGSTVPDGASAASFHKATEDLGDYQGILTPGQYHVVVGNPPYITVKDKVLNAAYRKAYATAVGKYALTVPFMELLFRLAIRGEQSRPAGHVGQITSNSFMKREFGRKVIEELFAGLHVDNPVDLTAVIDTSGAYIPGHGTPTVILVGRRRRPVTTSVLGVLGVRGEPGQPDDPARGRVWSEVVEHLQDEEYDGAFVTVTRIDRQILSEHPWSLSGGGAGELFDALAFGSSRLLSDLVREVGIGVVIGEEEGFELRRMSTEPAIPVVTGDVVRDFLLDAFPRFWPYNDEFEYVADVEQCSGRWPYRRSLRNYVWFGRTRDELGKGWLQYGQMARSKVLVPLSIAFAFVATHNHFVLDRGGKVFKQSAPVIKLPEGASEEQHLELLGVLNSSTACFWLKQVSYPKGGDPIGGDGARVSASGWDDRYEFTGTKLQEFPLPSVLPLERGRILDSLAREFADVSPSAVVQRWLAKPSRPLEHELGDAFQESFGLRARMVFEQEELDWEVYRLYGLTDDDLTSKGGHESMFLGQRAFEIALARRVAGGEEETAWFERHGSAPITEIPAEWPEDYRSVVQQRLDLIASDRSIRLLERPEYKRRWASVPWEKQQTEALTTAILDRLERPELWQDAQGPVTRTVLELGDQLRDDAVLRELISVHSGQSEPDIPAVLARLVTDQAVPYLAAHRYKPSGVEKYRAWQEVWNLQRREDAGEKVTIPVPPKYINTDFRKTSYWQARGKLDVPKERFVSYPDARRDGDPTPVLGWAGWSHRDQALALAREIFAQQSQGADDAALVPLVAGLVELEAWVTQWHSEVEAAFGTSAAAVVTGQIDAHLAGLEMTRDQVTAWTPAPTTRGRRSANA